MKCTIKKILVCLLATVISFSVFLTPGQNEIGTRAHASMDDSAVSCSGAVIGEDVRISSRLWELLFGKDEEEAKKDDTGTVLLLAGGTIFGAKIKQSYLCVTDPGSVKELKAADRIISANGKAITSAQELRDVIAACGGKEIKLVVRRDDKQISVGITPRLEDGEYSLGILLKDGAAGIGTVTYIDPKTGEFGGLGHGICDPDTGELIDMKSGTVTGVILGGVKRGEAGKPGELSGILTEKVSGTLYANTECGVFGKLDNIPENLNTVPIEIATRSEVHEGEAMIYSTVKNGQSKEFKVEISEINHASTGTKSFKIKATDPALIAITGGVVRGMSGSPIIQDGKLVGAVTHVMVADPTEGYGIFIENMLSAANGEANRKAA